MCFGGRGYLICFGFMWCLRDLRVDLILVMNTGLITTLSSWVWVVGVCLLVC